MGMERRVISDLEQQQIYDVYFYNGRLFFLNPWEESAIRRLLKDMYPKFDQNLIQKDEDFG